MKKARYVTGLLIFTLTLVIAVAGSLLIIDRFSERRVAEVETTDKSDNKCNVLKSDNRTEKLSVKESKDTEEKVNSETKQKIVLSTNKTKKTTKRADKKKKHTKKATSKLKNIGTYMITGYCGCGSCCGKSDGVTASGTRATAGRTIAADISNLPFGTKVVIDGHTYTVEDVGGAIKGNHIDVYFSSHSKALQWG